MEIPSHLRKRHHQSAIVSAMVLVIFDCMREVYQRKPSLNAMLEEMIIACLVRRNDFEGGEPMTAMQMHKKLGIPRTNAIRAANILVETGVLKRQGQGFVGNLDYLETRIEAAYFVDMLTAIQKAAHELQQLEG